MSHTRLQSPAENALCHKSGTFKGQSGESVRGPLIRSWPWSLARGRQALLPDEMGTDSSPRHHLARGPGVGNAVAQAMQLVMRWQGSRQACPDCWPYASWPAPQSKIGCEPLREAWVN